MCIPTTNSDRNLHRPTSGLSSMSVFCRITSTLTYTRAVVESAAKAVGVCARCNSAQTHNHTRACARAHARIKFRLQGMAAHCNAVEHGAAVRRGSRQRKHLTRKPANHRPEERPAHIPVFPGADCGAGGGGVGGGCSASQDQAALNTRFCAGASSGAFFSQSRLIPDYGDWFGLGLGSSLRRNKTQSRVP